MRSCVLAGLAEWHGHTVCSHCESVPSKYLNGTMSSRYLKHGQHTISPVSFSPLQPRHTVSVRALSSSSSSSSIRVSFIPDNPTGASSFGGPPVGMTFISCVALSVVPRWARFYPCFFENCPRARSGCSNIQRFVRRRHDGENNDCQRAREKCGVLYAARREAPDDFDAFRFCVQPHSFSAVIVSQAGKLASKLSPNVGSALIMSCCQVWPCAVVRLSCQLQRRFVVVARRRVFGRAPCRPCGRIR